jgi:diadenosine tetraphosphate (Ap4A) HIT family hydrolase
MQNRSPLSVNTEAHPNSNPNPNPNPDSHPQLWSAQGTLPGEAVPGNEGTGKNKEADNWTACAFCQRSRVTANILQESPHFLIVADHAPLIEGHILIIPKEHHTCYGAVPAALDAELFALKQEVGRFFEQYYAPIVFWEHGVFRQTVFHAHLHCFPFGGTQYNASEQVHSLVVYAQDDLRHWYNTCGHYFYMEDARGALLFAPELDRYTHIVKDVLTAGVAARSQQVGWRSQQQRLEEGEPLIQATFDKWRRFQQKGAGYANRTTAR